MDALWKDVRFALRMLRRTPGVAVAAIVGSRSASARTLPSSASSTACSSGRCPIAIRARSGGAQRQVPGAGAVSHSSLGAGAARSAEDDAGDVVGRRLYVWRLEFVGRQRRARACVRRRGVGKPLSHARRAAGARAQLADDEQLQGHNHVALIDDSLWRQRFGADAAIVGKKLLLDNESFEIIGVRRAACSSTARATCGRRFSPTIHG